MGGLEPSQASARPALPQTPLVNGMLTVAAGRRRWRSPIRNRPNVVSHNSTITRWSAEFADPAEELGFRRRSAADARSQNRITIAVGGALMLGHIAADVAANGGTDLLPFHIALRLVAVIACLGGIWLAGRRDVATADSGVFFAQIVATSAFMVIITTQRPEVMAERLSVQSMTAILLVLAHYAFIATRVTLNAAAAIYTSVLYVALSLASGRLGVEALIMEAVMHVAANFVGYITAARYQRLRRRQHRVQREQAQSNARLRALAGELERARDAAVVADRSKSQFLAHMSHELRSPLNAMIGFAEIMKQQVFGPIRPERYGQYAEDIHDAGSHMLAVINDMLDLSKAEAGKREVRDGEVDLGEVSGICIRLLRERAARAGVVLESHIPDHLPPVRGDEHLIKQMTLNLLTNAVNYTPEGGAVSVEAAIAGDGALSLSVTDTGVGIAAEEIPKVLQAYGQAETARERRVGRGLDLHPPFPTRAHPGPPGGVSRPAPLLARGATILRLTTPARSRKSRCLAAEQAVAEADARGDPLSIRMTTMPHQPGRFWDR